MSTLDKLVTQIKVGKLETSKIAYLSIRSVRSFRTTRAVVILKNIYDHIAPYVKIGDKAKLSLGYAGDQLTELNFKVESLEQTHSGHLNLNLVFKDHIWSEKKIKKAWKDEKPENIVRYLMDQTDLEVGKIKPVPGIVLPRCIASKTSIWDIIRQMESTIRKQFNKELPYWTLWLDSKGKVNWSDDFEKTDRQYIFKSGENIAQHLPDNWHKDSPHSDSKITPLNYIETFFLPDIRHSGYITVKDGLREIKGEFPVMEVEHEFSLDKARTHIWYASDYKKEAEKKKEAGEVGKTATTQQSPGNKKN